MKRAILLISFVSLIAVIAGCGSGSSTANVDTSTVTVSVGGDGRSAGITVEKNSFLVSVNKLFRALIGSNEAAAAIPTEVTRILFTISAPDITTITRLVDVAGRSSISESFNLPNGNNRTILVQALDSQGRVLYEGSRVINLNGVPVSVDIDMTVLNDFTPPTFSGLSTATAVSTTEIGLTWNPASDNLTPASQIYYFIYISNSPGGENFSSPTITTNPGVTTFNVTGLNPETTYYFVARAVDAHGNTDSNLVERSATTLTPPDVTPPTFAGLTSAIASAAVNGRIDLSWSPATDNRTSSSSMVYLIYMATLSGQENYITPNFTSPAGATAFSITGLSAGNYYFVVRARDEAGNIDSNTHEIYVDYLPPTVVTVNPADGSTGVVTNPNITVIFSEAMNTSSITATTFNLWYSCEGICEVNGTVTANGASAQFTPSQALYSNTTYTATITTYVTDQAGNHLAAPYNWTFTTADFIPPYFGGITSADQPSCNGTVTLGWSPASEYDSPPVRYLIYIATQPGGQNFASPNFTTDPGATSFSFAPVGLADGTYYLVVRAMDAAGNIDTNTIEYPFFIRTAC